MPDPYRSPQPTRESNAAPPRRAIAFQIALVVWLCVTLGLIAARAFLKPLFEDFEVVLPVLTPWTFHPASAIISIAITFGVMLRGQTTQKLSNRIWFGRIALAAGIVALVVLLLGTLLPLVSLWIALA